ncbi:MAG: dihydrolipoyl dehydrogenase [Actinomycetota bacterium]
MKSKTGHEPERHDPERTPILGDSFDLIVIGGGTGGYSTAIRGASLGLKTALVERAKVGGTCLHWGCIPTKALLHAGEVLDTANEANDFGIKIGETGYDWDGVQSYKDKVVGKMYRGLNSLMKHRGIEIVEGTASFEKVGEIKVEGRTLRSENIVIATGSVPKMLPGLELSDRVITSDQALSVPVPGSAIVLGGGAIGCEFASVWRSFGAEVTLVEMLPNLVPLEDADCGKELARAFKKRGIEVHTGVKLEDITDTGDGVTASLVGGEQRTSLSADVILIAVGRRPVTEGLSLDKIGLTPDERGFVPVDEQGRTGVEGTWAVGDVIDTPMLAHVSFIEGMSVAERIAGQSPRPIDYDAIPRATYSMPEVGAVGLTELQAKEAGYEVETHSVPMQAIGKATILGSNIGFCKVVSEKGGRILGVHFVGARVTELVAEAMLAVGWEARPDEVGQLIHPHPSLSEIFGETALTIAGRALHAM